VFIEYEIIKLKNDHDALQVMWQSFRVLLRLQW